MKRYWLGLAAAVVALLFTGHFRSLARPPHQAVWLPAQDVVVRTVTAGAGDTTVILLHGYAESLMAFRPMFDRLAQNYRVVALDLPGFGVSDKPESGPYDLASYVARLTHLLESHSEGPTVVVGHSMGGEVAAALALALPDKVVAAVLIAPAGYGLSPAFASLTRDNPDVLSWVNSLVGLVLPVHDPRWLAEPEALSEYDPVLDPAYRHSLSQVLAEFDFAGLRGRLGEIRQPVLLIWGKRDPTIPLEFGEEMARDLPCVTMLTVQRTLHRPHQTEPGLVASAIEEFLKEPGCGPDRSSGNGD